MKNLADSVDVKKEFPSLIEFLTDRCRIIHIGKHVNIGALVSYPLSNLVRHPLSNKWMDIGKLNLVYSFDRERIVSKCATINPEAIGIWNNGLDIMLTAYINGDEVTRGDKYKEIPFP